ncbi:MAG: ArnT family glycosyltransferase [Sedimentisphaeraceae bacterium JB056]
MEKEISLAEYNFSLNTRLKKLLSNTYMLIGFIITLSVCLRVYCGEVFDNGGDAFWMWRVCREFMENGTAFAPPGNWDHRMLRWALYLPMMLLLKIFGGGPIAYFTYPIFVTTLSAILIFFIGKKLHSKTAGLFASVIFTLYPTIVEQGSQILPTGTVTMCLLGSILCLLYWQEKNKWYWLAISSFLVFWGYGAKITMLFFVPGIVLYLIYVQYQKKSVPGIIKSLAIFGLVFIVLLTVETAVFEKITTFDGGRLGCLIHGRHGSSSKMVDKLGYSGWQVKADNLPSYLLYFSGYDEYAGDTNAALINLGILAAIVIVLLKQRHLYAIAYPYIVAYLLFTYLVVGVYPFVRPERILERYYNMLYTLSIIMQIVLYMQISNNFIIKLKTKSNQIFNVRVATNILLCFIFMVIFAEIPKPTNNLRLMSQNYNSVKKARQENIPILMTKKNISKDFKQIKRYRSFYGKTDESFYSRPKIVKIVKDNETQEYYLLEHGQTQTAYLLVEPEKEFKTYGLRTK